MAAQISISQLNSYKRTARMRLRAEQTQIAVRRERAWALVRQAAALLKSNYAATRVVVFGSLIHQDRFTEHSDIDIAAWGLTDANWLKAIGEIRTLDHGIEINLVDVTCATNSLLDSIEREGVEI